MAKDLYKVSNKLFIVAHDQRAERFSCVDSACDYLESIGVPSHEVDFALVNMTTNNNTHAHFGVVNGGFIFSDNKPFAN